MINRSAAFLPFVLLLSNASLSQTPTGGPLSGLSSVDRQNREQERRNDRDLDRRMNAVRDLERSAQLQSARMRKPEYKEAKLSPEAKDRVREVRKIAPPDIGQYAEFLKAENTGIFKLFPNFNCQTDELIRIDGDCADFVPMSSDFSFRQKSYIDSHYADLQFIGGELRSTAFFSQGIIMSLGDVPIESVLLEDVPEITKLAAAKNMGEAKTSASDLLAGYSVNGKTLTSRTAPQVNVTYALRVFAYKVANSFPPLSDKTTRLQMKFMSLAFDKRSDEVIVFRILRRDELGGLTIVWKRLQKLDPPKIKFAKDEIFRDFHN